MLLNNNIQILYTINRISTVSDPEVKYKLSEIMNFPRKKINVKEWIFLQV